MSWRPISEEELWDHLNRSWERMDFHQRYLWDQIQIPPEKWQQHPWGDLGGGFWAVAILGRTVIYYNDIEDGFNRSTYTQYGQIDHYFCNQDRLESAVGYLLGELTSGAPHAPHTGPPEPPPTFGTSR